MNGDFEFSLIVRKSMGELISSYDLKFIEVNDGEVLLRSFVYAIHVMVDRNGVSIIYFDIAQKPIKGYNIFLFLINKRRDQIIFSKSNEVLGDYSELIEGEVRNLAAYLRSAGQDILSGSKEWIKSYSWPTIEPSSEISRFI